MYSLNVNMYLILERIGDIMEKTENLASEIWAIADVLRGDFKQSQYGRIILPFCILRRLECVLEKTKSNVVEEYEKIKKQPESTHKKQLLRIAKLPFYNISPLNMGNLGETQTRKNLQAYINNFSEEAKTIFEKIMGYL
jgi:type I restriction enzyme M protein